ncbi:PE family protein [Mycobacterium bourgelatii]|uniref:PE domain-containing protein n=1 Tax=Mycobacterium bourgelatii TaxID=1273442 RepID=A0A7I9YPF3_MYCBU|nr:hypothetical protein MBOU_25400 [Mycobacterium bourgelatii]
MTFLLVSPELVAAAASDVAGIGLTVSAANSVAAQATTGLVSAAADEVSRAIAVLFSGHAVGYQELAVQAAAVHGQFVQALAAGGVGYATAEALNVGPLQPLLDLINAPTQQLLGRPLIGDGANAAPGSGQAGGLGGLLWGNGGHGGSGAAGQPGGRGGDAGLIGAGVLGAPGAPVRPAGPAGPEGGYTVPVGQAALVATVRRREVSVGPVGPAGCRR